MRITLAAASSCLALAACAGLIEQDCRSDPYELGVRDARRALPPQAETHVAQCRAFGVDIDAARYMEGWRSAYRFHPFGA
jgi:hypothetical protein